MATISKIVKNIYGEDELIQLIVPDGWGVRVVPHPRSAYSIWRRLDLPNNQFYKIVLVHSAIQHFYT